MGTVVMSKKSWDKLSPKGKEAMLEMGREVNELRKSIRDTQEVLLKKAMETEGVHVYRPEGAALDEFRARGAKAQQALVKSIGPSSRLPRRRTSAPVRVSGKMSGPTIAGPFRCRSASGSSH